MKRQIALVLSVLLMIPLLALAACGRNGGSSFGGSMAGFYRLTDASGKSSGDLLKIRDGVTLEVRGDNTGVLALMNDRSEVVFDPDAGLCRRGSDAEVPYTFDGDRIILDSKQFRMVFERE